jgi:hypothetical protein
MNVRFVEIYELRANGGSWPDCCPSLGKSAVFPPSTPQRPVAMAAFGCLTDLYRRGPGGGIFDFRQ